MTHTHIPTHQSHVFAPKQHDYCVVVGVLNEGDKFRRQLEKMQGYRQYADIIIADGGSSDGATGAQALKDKVTALYIKQDEGGLSAQYRMAFYYALEMGYRGIISVDGNDKDGMDAIPRFVEALENGADLVQGSRFVPGGVHKNTPFIRQFGIRFVFNPLMWIASGFRYTDGMNGFKAFSRRALLDAQVQPFRKVFQRYSLQYYLCYRLPRLGYKIVEIPVSRVYPDSGEVPTKITGIMGYTSILKELFSVLFGCYNPRKDA